MKKLLMLGLCVLALLAAGCTRVVIVPFTEEETESVTEEATEEATEVVQTEEPELELEPPTLQYGLYDGRLVTSDSKNSYIRYEIINERLCVSGRTDNPKYNYVLLQYEGEDQQNQVSKKIDDGYFSISRPLPDSGSAKVNLFAGEEEYGQYDGIVGEFVEISNENGMWDFVPSPVLRENMEIFFKDKGTAEDSLKRTVYIQSDSDEIISLSDSITKDAKDDYDKVLKIHDWVAENIWYDMDSFNAGKYPEGDALSVLETKKGVCEGYANLFAALVRAQNIPCRIQEGYALGIGEKKEWTEENMRTSEGNHAWNEVYVDERWIIVDSTWDSPNKIENGQEIKEGEVNHLYFDSNLEFFSFSHRLMKSKYELRR